MYNNPLHDRDFLKRLDNERNREIYARITLLTFDEQPIEYIEGKVTGGSINIDGASAVRRTCSLSMVSANLDINIYLLGLERKFKLEIGLKNNIESKYPDIIWFNQGLYVTTSVSTSRSVNNYSISISGKDKMCLLNGDIAGALPASVDFGTLEYYSDDGTQIFYKDITLKDIIRQAVETYGNEVSYNIVINDLEDNGFELLEYKGDDPLYIFVRTDNNSCENITLDQNFIVYVNNVAIKVSNIANYDNFSEIASNTETQPPTKITMTPDDTITYTVIKTELGQTVGYRETELTYAGELVANIGETITSVLDKVKNMLVNFEYFYDLDGRFIFQKKKTYEDENLSLEIVTEEDGTYYESNKVLTELFYNFEGNELITAFNNSPSLADIKNDYSIWGVREGISGGEIPIHLRFALDTKPIQYTTYRVDVQSHPIITYYDINNYPEYSGKSWVQDKHDNIIDIYCDWREIIYQMSLDYYKFKDIKDDFYNQIMRNNLDETGVSLYPGGRTGYEQYYIDMNGFWRNIYSPGGFYHQVLLTENLYKKGYYYIKDRFKKNDPIGRFATYSKRNLSSYDDSLIYYEKDSEEEDMTLKTIKGTSKVYYENCYSKIVRQTPNQLNFWIDFLDTTGDIGRFSVKAIGQRPKNVNDSDVTSIYYRKVPNLIFHSEELSEEEKNAKKTAYSYIKTSPLLENCFSVSSQGKSAWDELETYLNENTYCKESVSITAIPIYYLEPNVRIGIKDEKSKVNGEYLLSKITIPLTFNGTMSLTATKAVSRIY